MSEERRGYITSDECRACLETVGAMDNREWATSDEHRIHLDALGVMDKEDAERAIQAAGFWQQHAQANVRKEAAFLLAHIAASVGTRPQTQVFVHRPHAFRTALRKHQFRKAVALLRCALRGHRLATKTNIQATYVAYDIVCKSCRQNLVGFTIYNRPLDEKKVLCPGD